MPQFVVTGPDGKKYKVAAPEGASQDDVMAYVQKNAGAGEHDPQRQEQPAPPTAFAGKDFSENGATWDGLQNFAHGAVQGLGDEIKAGVAAVKESFTGGLPIEKAYDQALSAYRGARDDYREDSPGSALATEAAGSIATSIPAMAGIGSALRSVPFLGRLVRPATTVAGRMAQNAAIGAPVAAAYGFNEGEGGAENRAVSGMQSGAIGGMTGAAVPAIAAGVGRVIQPVRSRLSDELTRLSQSAKSEGVPLSAAQQTGSKPLQLMESVFGNLPMTAGPQRAQQATQRAAFNRAVLAKAGVDADSASPEVMDRAFREIGSRFDDVASRTTVDIDDVFHQNIADVAQNYGRRLSTDVAPVFQSYIDDIAAMQAAASQPGVAGVTIGGKEFQKVYSDLRRAARGAKSRPDLQQALNGLADSFDDAMARTGSNPSNLPPPPGAPLPMATNPADEWAAARGDYRNLLAIDKAMNSGTVAAVGGDIPPSALNQAVRQQGGYTRGRGDINDLARVGNAFVRDNIPDSATAQRILMQNLLTGGVAGGAGYLGSDNPMTGLAFALGGMAAPRAIQMAYQSPGAQKYLANTALDQIAAQETRRALAKALAYGTGTTAGEESAR